MLRRRLMQLYAYLNYGKSFVYSEIPMRKIVVIFLIFFIIVAVCLLKRKSVNAQLPPGVKADRVIIIKSERRLKLLSGSRILKEYRIALGRNPIGPKTRQGDSKTPEGNYFIDYRNPRSKFHLALHISYPNSEDIRRAAKMGVSPGGDIMIHGIGKWGWIGKLHCLQNWTQGCIAVTNAEIEEIWRAVPDGTPVTIKP